MSEKDKQDNLIWGSVTVLTAIRGIFFPFSPFPAATAPRVKMLKMDNVTTFVTHARVRPFDKLPKLDGMLGLEM